MDVKLTLSLPRDARFVPLMRNVAGSVLHDVDAPSDAVEDVKLVVSEACSNAVRHATGVDEYSVSLMVDEGGCVLEVDDAGPGFDRSAIDSSLVAENGRGIPLMQALVDDACFDRADWGMRVRLVIRWPEEEELLLGESTGDGS